MKKLLSESEKNKIRKMNSIEEGWFSDVLDSIKKSETFKDIKNKFKELTGVDFDEMEDTLYRIENKLDRVLSKLDSISSENKNSVFNVAPENAISAEDRREIDELKRLAAGGSTSEWDN